MGNDERIDCLRCAHYFVTWNPAMPRGCRLYGFKSTELPDAVVLKSTGEECLGYERKQ